MVRASKTEKILLLSTYGKYLGYQGMNFTIRNKNQTTEEKIPFHEVKEVTLQSGNSVSTGALSAMMFWGIDALITTASGKPVGTMTPIEDGSHVKTRICQYEALKNRKSVEIAKQLVLKKIEAEEQLLRKRRLEGFEALKFSAKERIKLLDAENVDKIRNRLTPIEGKHAQHYFNQIVVLLPKFLQINKREGYRAFDAGNNLFNIAYEVLRWKILRALIKSKLEPYLGFLHRISHNHAALVSDFMELYRCIIDDFLIDYSQQLKEKDFEKHYLSGHYNKKTPRIFLKHPQTNRLIKVLSKHFEKRVKIPAIRRGKEQSIETLINEEASLLAMYIRGDRSEWNPRVVVP